MAVKIIHCLIHDMSEHRLLAAFRHKSVDKGKKIGCNRIVPVPYIGSGIGPVHEFTVIRFLDGGCHAAERIYIGIMPGKGCETFHHAKQIVIGGGTQKPAVSLAGRILGMDELRRLRRHAPVAVRIIRDYAVRHAVRSHEIHPFFH